MSLKELLKEKDMTGAQLARRLNRTRSAVSSWVCGRAEPSVKEVRSIANALDVSVDTVLDCFEEKQSV